MKTTVVATGDSLFTADFPKEYVKIRKEVDNFIQECDVRITNLETNLSDFGGFPNQYSGGTWLNTKKDLFPYLESFGFNFYGTANNHCMDYSYQGLLSTIDCIEKSGHMHAGTGKNLYDAEKPAIIQLNNGKTAAIFALDTSFELPSIAGKTNNVYEGRPGVNYLRHENIFHTNDEDMINLKRIAKSTGINFYRDEEIASGYLLPDKEGTFVFGSTTFTTDKSLPISKCNEKDLNRIINNIQNAKKDNELVFLLVHCHDEEGIDSVTPPTYLKELCHTAIDAGVDAIFGGGCHELRGLEMYQNKPIFYSLGDFIYQGMRVEHLPPDFLEKYGVDINASAKEALDARSHGGKIGLQTNVRNFLTILPQCTFDGNQLVDLTMMPVKLCFQNPNEQLEGLPYFATGDEGQEIFNRFQKLSMDLGTKLIYENGYIKLQ